MSPEASAFISRTFDASGSSVTDTTQLKAEATFTASGNQLTLVLSNTASTNVLTTANALYALFFDFAPGYSLTKQSASLTAGSNVYKGTTLLSDFNDDGISDNGASTDIGGAFAFKSGMTNAPGGGDWGVTSAGLGLNGTTTMFSNINLVGEQNPPDGPPYGILSAGHVLGSGNSGVNNTPLVKSSVTFSFLITAPQNASSEDVVKGISNVVFHYGTALTADTNLTGTLRVGTSASQTQVPEPSALALLGIGALALRKRLSTR